MAFLLGFGLRIWRLRGNRLFMVEKFSVLNLPVHLGDNYADWLLERSHRGLGSHVVTLNAEMAMLGDDNPEVAEVIRAAELVIPDGAGIVIYLKLRGLDQQRCPGIELAERLIEILGDKEGELIAFYGGKPGVTEEAALAWQKKIPQINIINAHGYLAPPELETWQETLQAQRPRLILVGLGVPRQEFWIRDHRHLCPQAIWIGVGGSFDIWSGTKERAPRWLRENHLEWSYRLYQEPWRWKRMLALPKFFWRSLLKG